MKTNLKSFFVPVAFLLIFIDPESSAGQSVIQPVYPPDKAVHINTCAIQWAARPGLKYDLYLGTETSPELYRENLETMELKPVPFELNKTYYWKVTEKKDGKAVSTSKVFSFSTLPIQLKPGLEYKPFVDLRDDKIYWTISKNGNDWFAQNLDFDLKGNSWYYNNNEANKAYGRLYSGVSVGQNQKEICPAGWHVPSFAEWKELLDLSGGPKAAGKMLKEASGSFWQKSNYSANNEGGMTVLPAGSRDSKPSFANLGKYCFFWTSTPNPKIPGSHFTFDFGFMRDNVNNSPGDPNWSYSIRCVKDQQK